MRSDVFFTSVDQLNVPVLSPAVSSFLRTNDLPSASDIHPLKESAQYVDDALGDVEADILSLSDILSRLKRSGHSSEMHRRRTRSSYPQFDVCKQQCSPSKSCRRRRGSRCRSSGRYIGDGSLQNLPYEVTRYSEEKTFHPDLRIDHIVSNVPPDKAVSEAPWQVLVVLVLEDGGLPPYRYFHQKTTHRIEYLNDGENHEGGC